MSDPSHFSSIGWLLVCLAAIAAGANQITSLWQKWTRPNGTDAMANANAAFQAKGDYVTRGEFQELKREVSAELETIRREIGEMETRMSDASEERIRRVHQRLDTIPDRIITQLSTLGLLRRPDHP
ncbi:MAG: hypothetical protein J0L84_00450 [Verrucomicrobia bacterium]|nr:hypothetical protein [Verrucomicrobiota bacterium]